MKVSAPTPKTLKLIFKFFLPIILSIFLLVSSNVQAIDQETEKLNKTTYNAIIEDIQERSCPDNPEKFCTIAEITVFLKTKEIEKTELTLSPDEKKVYKKEDKIWLAKTKDGQYEIISTNKTFYFWTILIVIGSLLILFTNLQAFKLLVTSAINLSLITLLFIPIVYEKPNLLLPLGLPLIFFLLITNQFILYGIRRKSLISLLSSAITLLIGTGLTLLLNNIFRIDMIAEINSGHILNQRDLGSGISFNHLFTISVLLGVVGVIARISNIQTDLVAKTREKMARIDFWRLFLQTLSNKNSRAIPMINTLILIFLGLTLPLLYTQKVIFETGVGAPFIYNNNEFLKFSIYLLIGIFTILISIPITTLISSFYHTKIDRNDEIKIRVNP